MKIELDTDFRLWPLASGRPAAIRGYAGEMRNHGHHGAADLLEVIADKIEAQSRIPEPGLWGVVEAHVPGIPRIEWVRGRATENGNDWHSLDGNWHRVWDDLIDPALVREGLDS